MDSTTFSMFQTALCGLGIFVLGMKLLSDGTQALAGSRLNRIICAVTDNRFLAVLVGVAVTGVIQSSSATTVMVIGFVNSGLMTLMQSIGVIFGANIGTTMSMWILTLNIAKYGGMLVGVASFVYLFAKKDRTHYIGMAVLGLGMLFLGLEIMSDGFKPIRNNEQMMAYLGMFEATSTFGFIKAALAGMIATALIQSSTAFIGIVMGLAANQVVGFETSVALIMGSNIGTTITAGLACIGASRSACRAALAHLLFNVIGVSLVVCFNSYFVASSEKFIRWVSSNPSGPLNLKLAIAIVHTSFNVSCTLILLPFMGLFAKVVTFMIPVKTAEAKSERYKPMYLDKRLVNTPTVALAQASREILRMGDICLEMLADLRIVLGLKTRNEQVEDAIFLGEENLDVAQKDIAEYVSNMLHDNVTHSVATAARRQIKQADEFESVSDNIRNVLKAYIKILKADETLTDQAMAEELDLCDKVTSFCTDVMDIVKTGDASRIEWAKERSKEIDKVAKQYRNCHLQRLAISCTSPVKSLVYSDMLIGFRYINDHLLNIAETLEGTEVETAAARTA